MYNMVIQDGSMQMFKISKGNNDKSDREGKGDWIKVKGSRKDDEK